MDKLVQLLHPSILLLLQDQIPLPECVAFPDAEGQLRLQRLHRVPETQHVSLLRIEHLLIKVPILAFCLRHFENKQNKYLK